MLGSRRLVGEKPGRVNQIVSPHGLRKPHGTAQVPTGARIPGPSVAPTNKMGVRARARKFPFLNQVLKLRSVASLGEVRQQAVPVDGVLGRRAPAHELLGEQ